MITWAIRYDRVELASMLAVIALLLLVATPPAQSEGPSVISYPEAGTNKLYAFTGLANGRLFVHYWDGASWNWADQGAPPGTTVVDQPGAITYSASGVRRIYGFVRGANGHLLVNWWNGSTWRWADQGTPPGTTAASAPCAVTYQEGTQQRIYAFVRGANGRLFANWWNGSVWQWANQGTPPGTTLVGAPSAITYYISERRIYAFMRGANGHLYVNYWNGSGWQWADQGAPARASVASPPNALTYLEGTRQRIYAFVRASDGHLHVNFWDGTRWRWADQGRPSATAMFGTPAAITYRQATTQRIYVFVRDARARLFVNFWDGSQWRWADQGEPASGRVRRPYDVHTYFENAQRIYSFVEDDQSRLQLNFWNGSKWQWAETWQPWAFDWGTITYFQPNVPQGGRATAIAVNPVDERRVLVASETGGLFRSTDRGRSWGQVRGLPAHLLQDVEYAPGNPDVVIATAGPDFREPNGGGIWRSTDGGLSWNQPIGAAPLASARCPSRAGAHAVSFEPGSNRVYVATDCGLAVSENLGVSWTHTVLDPGALINSDLTQDRVWSVLARPGGNANVAAEQGIWYRRSAGVWTRASQGPSRGQSWVTHAFAKSPLNNDHLFLIADVNQLFKSVDGGQSWEIQSGPPRPYVFVQSTTQRLHVNHWNGTQWGWSDQDAPASPVASTASVVSYQGGRMYAFVRGGDGRLYVRYWNGSDWAWSDQGTPPSASVADAPSAVSYRNHMMVFVRTNLGALAKHEWDESRWSWSNQGMPPGTQVADRPSTITYDDGTRHVRSFVRGANGRLYMHFWTGTVWQWADQGTPTGTSVASSPAAITYRDSVQRIYVFVRGSNGRLYVNYWNGSVWQWADQGSPAATTVTDTPGAITYRDGPQHIYAFVRGADGRLYVDYWNGSAWQWAEQGAPSATSIVDAPVAITYFDMAQRIYAFVRGADARLYTNYWDGVQWRWADQGSPSGSGVASTPALVVFDHIGTANRPGFVRTARGANGAESEFEMYVGDGTNLLHGRFVSTADGLRNRAWSSPSVDHADPADLAFDAAGREPILLATDGGLHTSSDGGATWTQASAYRAGYNALQITEVLGQFAITTGTNLHLDLYYATQDNYIFASSDGGRTWPASACCEGFFLRGARGPLNHASMKITFVSCGPCANQIADPHLARVNAFPVPPDDDGQNDGAEGNPIFIRPGHYVQRTVNNDTAPTISVFKLTQSTGGSWTTKFSIPQPVSGLAAVVGDPTDPTLYQAVVRPGLTPDGLTRLGLTKITDLYGSGQATVTDADGIGLGALGIFPTQFAWYVVFAASPADPNFLIAPDIEDNRMKISTDGGFSWRPIDELTRLVTRDGTIRFRDREFTAVSNIAFSPVNASHILVGTVQGGIVRSTDRGTTWRGLAGTEMLPRISSFFFEDEAHVIVSTYGRGLWRLNLDPVAAPRLASADTQQAPARLPTAEPLVVDPETGSFVRLDTFELRRTCPNCRYVLAREGEITDIQMTNLTVESIKLSQGYVVSTGADRREVAERLPYSVDKTLGSFSANRSAAKIRAKQLPIRGLVLDGSTLRGFIVASSPVAPNRVTPPLLHVETRDSIAGIAKASPNESITVRGEGFDPGGSDPIVLHIGDREVARTQIAPDGSFTVRLELREPPGDYRIVAALAGSPEAPLAKTIFKVVLRDVR